MELHPGWDQVGVGPAYSHGCFLRLATLLPLVTPNLTKTPPIGLGSGLVRIVVWWIFLYVTFNFHIFPCDRKPLTFDTLF